MTTANTIPTQGNEVKYRKAKLWPSTVWLSTS